MAFTAWLYARFNTTILAIPYRVFVQLSENASAQVLKGRVSRSRGHGRPTACSPFRVRRALIAGTRIVQTPYGRSALG
jgi:hypothetical protein